MAYAIITTCFVRIENFDYSFCFMFSAVYFRERERELWVSFEKGGNWVCSSFTVEINAK